MADNFDRFINVTLTGPSIPDLVIPTLRHGVKQEVSVSGTFLPGSFATNIELRIANLESTVDFSVYKNVLIEAGYNGTGTGTTSGEAQKGVITGQLTNAFKESPGPDGMTVFQIIVGDYQSGVFQDQFVLSIPFGTSMSGVFGSLVSGHNSVADANHQLSITYTDILGSVVYPTEYKSESLTFKQHLDKIQDVMRNTPGSANPWSTNLGFMVDTEGSKVRCFFGGDNTSDGKLIKYVSSPPRNEGGSFSFIAPWDMSLRTNDVLQIPNSFARQSFGGFVATPTGGSGVTKKWILSVAFDFSTTQATNKMNVKCLYTGPGQ